MRSIGTRSYIIILGNSRTALFFYSGYARSASSWKQSICSSRQLFLDHLVAVKFCCFCLSCTLRVNSPTQKKKSKSDNWDESEWDLGAVTTLSETTRIVGSLTCPPGHRSIWSWECCHHECVQYARLTWAPLLSWGPIPCHCPWPTNGRQGFQIMLTHKKRLTISHKKPKRDRSNTILTPFYAQIQMHSHRLLPGLVSEFIIARLAS